MQVLQALEVTPIDAGQQQQVLVEVKRYINLAQSIYQEEVADIPVAFDLRGRSAGMYKVTQKSVWSHCQRQIRFNPWLFAKYFDDSWHNTIPHEVAHYIADCRFTLSKIKPHGKEWRQIMQDFGAEPVVRANYNLDGIPLRQSKRFNYRCACRQLALSSQRHNKIQQGIQSYLCRDCQQALVRVS